MHREISVVSDSGSTAGKFVARESSYTIVRSSMGKDKKVVGPPSETLVMDVADSHVEMGIDGAMVVFGGR